MTDRTIPCRAKNPAKCSYRGNIAKAQAALARGDFSTYEKAQAKADKAARKTGEVAAFLGISNKELNKNFTDKDLPYLFHAQDKKNLAEQANREYQANQALLIAEAHHAIPNRLITAFGATTQADRSYSVGGDSSEVLTVRKSEARVMYQAAADALIRNSEIYGLDADGNPAQRINWQGASDALRAAYVEQHGEQDTNNMMCNGRLYVNDAYQHTIGLIQKHTGNNTDLAAPLPDLDPSFGRHPSPQW